MQKIVLLLALLCSKASNADCVFMGDTKPKTYQIIDTYNTKHVDGQKVYGCLLKYKNEKNQIGFAYTHYNFICQLKESEKISLKNSEACCDSGDHGDYTCGLKPVNPLSQIPRVSTTLSPEKLDKRAWPDILDGLQDPTSKAFSAATKATEFFKDENHKSLVLGHSNKIKNMFLASKSQDQKAALGSLLLEMNPKDSDEFSIRLAQLQAGTGSIFYNKVETAQKISKFSSKGSEIVPAILEVVRLSYKADEKVAYLQVLENFPLETTKRLTQVHRVISSENIDPSVLAAWSKLVCKSLTAVQPTSAAFDWQSVQFSHFSHIPSVVCQTPQNR